MFLETLRATTATTPCARPMFLSADKRTISYASNRGSLITLELKKNSNAVKSVQDVAKMGIAQKAAGGEEQNKEESPGYWAALLDTLSFYVMEGVEIAAFGPYDEPATS